MATVYTLTAVLSPLPIVPTALLRPGSESPPVSKSLATGTAAPSVPALWNWNALDADMACRSAGGVFGVISGLVITAGSGLVANVAAGYAFVDGAVYRSATTVALSNGTRNYLWINQAQAVIPVPGSVTPPSGAVAFIGSVLTSGGAISAIDGSGVCHVGGMAWRRTGDAGAPGDTPPDCRLLTRTAGGIWLWDGVGHLQLG